MCMAFREAFIFGDKLTALCSYICAIQLAPATEQSVAPFLFTGDGRWSDRRIVYADSGFLKEMCVYLGKDCLVRNTNSNGSEVLRLLHSLKLKQVTV